MTLGLFLTGCGTATFESVAGVPYFNYTVEQQQQAAVEVEEAERLGLATILMMLNHYGETRAALRVSQ
jgi:hypothetical protein